MKFEALGIRDAFLIRAVPHRDERGVFARTWCAEEFGRRGLETGCVQTAVSWTRDKGTVRGLHYQLAPGAQSKLVGCHRGRICDVIVDLRPDSSTFECCVRCELGEEDWSLVYVPEGCAHGFQALTDDVLISYHYGAPHAPALERGVRFDDPHFAIEWPETVTVVSDKDRGWPDYTSLGTLSEVP